MKGKKNHKLMIHFQIQPELIGKITKVILTYNGVVVQEENIEDFTKEKLLREKKQLLHQFLHKAVEEVVGVLGIDKYKNPKIPSLIDCLRAGQNRKAENYLSYWTSEKGESMCGKIKKHLPIGNSRSKAMIQYNMIMAAINYLKGHEELTISPFTI